LVRLFREISYLFVLLLQTWCCTSAFSSSITAEAIGRHIEVLSGVGSRVAGYPGHASAEAYLVESLRGMGIKDVRRQTFRVTVPIDFGASLTLSESGESVPLACLWPNGIRTSMTPPGGVSGRFIDGGSGRLDAFSDLDLSDSIVLLDWRTGSAWQDVASLGARSIIFIEPKKAYREEGESKFVRTPVSVNRFMVAREAGLRLRDLCARSEEPLQVRLEAEMRWVEREVANLIVRIPGSDSSPAEEAVLVEAYYDAMSVVPGIAPGADQASGVAAALEIARELIEGPPQRTTVLVFTTAHFFGLAGVTEFLDQGVFHKDGSLTWPDLDLRFRKWFFLALDLSSRSRRVGALTSFRRNYIGSLGAEQRLQLIREWLSELLEANPPLTNGKDNAIFINALNRDMGEELSYSYPCRIPWSGELAELRQENAVSLVTAEDDRGLFDSPHDRFEFVDLGNVAAQARLCSDLIGVISDAEELAPEISPKPRDEWGRLRGQVLEKQLGGGLSEGLPLPGAVVTAGFRGEKTWSGVRPQRITFTDSEGRFELHGFEVPVSWAASRVAIHLNAYLLDPTSGRITHAPDLGAQAHGGQNAVMYPRSKDMVTRLYVFRCQPVDLFDLLSPRNLRAIEGLSVLRAKNNVEPTSYGLFSIPRDPKWGIDAELEPLSTLFLTPGERFKAVATTLLGNPSFLLAGIDDSPIGDELGRGFRAEQDLKIGPVAFPCAEDMYRIARHRTERFARYGIRNQGLDADLNKVDEALTRAEDRANSGATGRAVAFAREAWGMVAGAYPDVKRTADDMVVAVMFYMVMLLPFSVFLERLVVGAKDVRRRIGWSVGIFAIIFGVFRFIHPAFDISLTPALVLLSFVILVLSVVVMAIVISKFEEQFQKMREEMGELHEADIGRLSAAAMAFSLGVSNLRNRPLRTLFTSVALILMTFTVLAFSSIETYQGFHKRKRPGGARYNGFLITDPAAVPLAGQSLAKLENTFPDAVVCPRVWMLAGQVHQRGSELFMRLRYEAAKSPETADDSSLKEPGLARAVLRLSPRERLLTKIDESIARGRWFREDESDVCLIPSTLAKQWGISEFEEGAHYLRLYSDRYRIVGVFDEERFREIIDLDGHPISPIDFYAAASILYAVRAQIERRAYGSALAELERIDRLYPDQFIVVSNNLSRRPVVPPTEVAADWDTYLASVAVRFDTAREAEEAIRRYAGRTDLILFSGLDGERYEYSAHTGVKLSGSGGLLVPLIICGLIVFNTMLNAVFERRKEIGVLSAVGLAPTHIGFLFLGEACVYANLAAVLGYLIGQGVGKFLASVGILSDLALNFSALTAVFTSVVITLVVIVSSLYPAYIGGRMAVPSVERRWKLPTPKGDWMNIDLPFTISSLDRGALVAYVKEFLESHAEYVMADFHAADVSVDEEKQEIRLRARVWPEPYDLGVSQWIEFRLSPSAAEGSFEVALSIERLEGDVTSWIRTNRLFMKSIRKQFLFWRSLSTRQRKRYRDLAEAEGL
jgi:hypothetical protein